MRSKEKIPRINKIIDELQFRWIDTKTGWNKLSHKNLDNIVTDITGYETRWRKLNKDSCSEGNITTMPSEDSRTSVTLVRNSKTQKTWFKECEQALERLIRVFNDEKYFIQFQPNSGCESKELVDLVSPNEDRPNTFIELKQWTYNKPPTYAVIELLKNYYLYYNRNSVIENLIVLAPRKYYENFQNNGKGGDQLEVFLSFVDKLNETLKNTNKNTKIKVQYIDLEKTRFDECVKKLNKLLPESEWIESGVEGYDQRTKERIELHKYKGCFVDIEPKLISSSFNDLTVGVIETWATEKRAKPIS